MITRTRFRSAPPGLFEPEGQRTWLEPRFTGARAFSPGTYVVALLPLSFGSVVVDAFPKGADAPLAWYAAMGAFVIVGVLFLVAGFLVNRFLPELGLPRTLVVSALYAATEISRTLLVGYALHRNGLVFDMVLPHRFVSGGLTGLLLLGLVSIVLNDRARYVAEFGVLVEKTRAVERELAQLTDKIDEFIENLRETVRLTVDAAFTPILERSRSRHSVTEVVTDIVDLSDRVIRPLSADIAQALPDMSDISDSPPRVPLSRLMSLATLVKPFQPGSVSLVTFLLLFGGSLFSIGYPVGFVFLVAVMGLTALIHWAGTRFVSPRLPALTMRSRLLITSVLFALGPLIPTVALYVYSGDSLTLEGVLPIFYFVLVTEFLSWSLALLPAMRQGRQDNLDQLVAVTSDLTQVRARAEVRLRREKQRLAALVHGDIQSTLMATALKLQQPETKPSDVSEIIDAAHRTISDALTNSTFFDTPKTLDDVQTAISDTWQGIVTVDFDVETGVGDLVSQDADLGEILWQVVREATANAVKHGRATAVTVGLRVDPESHCLVCRVVNDGVADPQDTRDGGGQRLFAAVSEKFTRTFDGEQTIVTLHLPLPKSSTTLPIRSS